MMKNVLLGAVLGMALAATGFAQQIPRPAGTLAVQTLDHKTIDLKQFKGKYVVVAFLLTT